MAGKSTMAYESPFESGSDAASPVSVQYEELLQPVSAEPSPSDDTPLTLPVYDDVPVTDTDTPSTKFSGDALFRSDIAPSDTGQVEKSNIDTIVLSFAGDCTIGSDESYTWNTFDQVYEKVNDPSYFFSGVKCVFEADDFTFVNLEGTFTNAVKKAEKEYRFKGKPSYCGILVKGSVEGVTLANNHTLDYLEQGFEDTVNTLTEAGILYTYFDTYFIIEVKGIQIGFLGYKGWSHEEKSNKLLVQHVNEMREQGVDFIVANYHWGDMRSYIPNAQQKRMAHYAIDNGVDLVIGHHPHVIQGMEKYNGKNIVYSLGNFCYGGSSNPSDKDTIIYQHIITVDSGLGEIISCSCNIIPALISSEPNRNNYQPVIAEGEEKDRIMDKFLKLCDELNADYSCLKLSKIFFITWPALSCITSFAMLSNGVAPIFIIISLPPL